jgi:FMN-dependent oxidoreductase (nitrilotriacetate monooxygenase family)
MQMHLTGFMIYCPAPHTTMSWVYPPEKIRHQWYEIGYWEEIARTLEEGLFDMFFFADGWGGGNEIGIRYAVQWPAADPTVLIPRLSAVTENLGFAVTMSTTFYPPYMLARKIATMDHVTEGRIGWNIVTSINRGEARRFGLDALPPHDERYDRADEYLDLCMRLFHSWDDDAMVMDHERGIFADADKVDRFEFEGKWYRSTGPLSVVPSPQRVPYLLQAGSSDRGRDFAARWAEAVFASELNTTAMKAFCDDLAGRTEANGRDPDQLRVLWSASPIVAPTEAEARERQAEIVERIPLEASVAMMSGHLNLNLASFGLDTRLSALEGKVDGTQGMFDMWRRNNEDPTIGEAARRYGAGGLGRSALLGTPAQVAEEMITLLREGGGHGFQLTPPYYAPDYYRDLVDLLIPELQRQGVYRTSYGEGTMRDRMGGGLPPAWTRPSAEIDR